VLVRAPLSRVPENTIKFAVGIMLTTFGIFWGAEGTGVNWPGGELALLGVLSFVSLSSFVLVGLARRQHAAFQAIGVRQWDIRGRSFVSGGTLSSGTTGGSPPG
jgi:hypothetical protein